MSRVRLIAFALAASMASGLTAANLRAADIDGVMMSEGKMMVMTQGTPATALDHEMTMSDGSRVEPDGTVKTSDGKEIHLVDGEIIMMDGHVMRGGNPAAMGH